MKLIYVLILLLSYNSVYASDTILVQKSYSTIARPLWPRVPTRHLIAHSEDCFDGIELSMDCLIHESNDELDIFKSHIDCLKEDIDIIDLGKNYNFYLDVDFKHYDWIDEEIKAAMTEYVLRKLHITSWTLHCCDLCTSGYIVDKIAIFKRHIGEVTNMSIELPIQQNFNRSFDCVAVIYRGPIVVPLEYGACILDARIKSTEYNMRIEAIRSSCLIRGLKRTNVFLQSKEQLKYQGNFDDILPSK